MRTTRGVTLLEVLLAFSLLAVAVLALLGCLPVAARQQAASSMAAQSLFFATQKLDELLQRNEFLSTTPQDDNPFEAPVGNRRWWGAPDPGGRVGLQLVTVEVTWLDGSVSHRVQLQSLVAP